MFAILNGINLSYDSRPGWTFTSGISPDERRFRMPLQEAQKIKNGAAGDGTSQLLLVNGTDIKDIQELTLLGFGATDRQDEVELLVSDKRWIWPYAHVYRSFNIRRKTGELRTLNQATPRPIRTVVADIGYHKWSLREEQYKWTTEEIIEEVMDDVTFHGNGQGWTSQGIGSLNLPELEGVQFDTSGEQAISQLLALLGGMIGVTINDGGQAVLYNRMAGNELAQASQKGGFIQEIAGTPTFIEQDRAIERPHVVEVLFERVVEIRIDGRDGNSIQVNKAHPRPTMTNVVQTPEDLTVTAGRVVTQGGWLPIEDFITALDGKSPSPRGTKLPELSLSIINNGWLAPTLTTYGDAVIDSTGKWAPRISAVLRDYRLTYQLDRPWRDRVKQIFPYRVAVEDHETGTRPPALAYFDYAEFNRWRPMGDPSGSPGGSVLRQNNKLIKNVFSSPSPGASGNNILDTKIELLRPAPVGVSVVDPDQMIFRLDFKFDDTGRVKNYAHSAIVENTIATQDARKPVHWAQHGKLIAVAEKSVLLSASMGSPSDLRRYHIQDVTPAEASRVMINYVNGQALGPKFQVRVDPQISVARFAWQDSRAQHFYKAFSDFSGRGQATLLGLGQPINLGELESVARAIGAKVYTRFEDHFEGGFTTGMNPDVKIQGIIEKVTHEILPGPTGGALTTVTMPRERIPIGFRNFLPRGVLRIIDHFVDGVG